MGLHPSRRRGVQVIGGKGAGVQRLTWGRRATTRVCRAGTCVAQCVQGPGRGPHFLSHPAQHVRSSLVGPHWVGCTGGWQQRPWKSSQK